MTLSRIIEPDRNGIPNLFNSQVAIRERPKLKICMARLNVKALLKAGERLRLNATAAVFESQRKSGPLEEAANHPAARTGPLCFHQHVTHVIWNSCYMVQVIRTLL